MDDNYSENDLQKETLADFTGLFADLDKTLQYKDHPDQDILRAYIANRLLDAPRAGRVGMTFREEQAFEAFLQGRLVRWTRSDVAMHVLTCQVCQQQVMHLRESRWRFLALARTQPPREQRSWRQRFAIGAMAGAAVVAVIFALWLWPPVPSPIDLQQAIDGGVMVVYRAPGRRF